MTQRRRRVEVGEDEDEDKQMAGGTLSLALIMGDDCTASLALTLLLSLSLSVAAVRRAFFIMVAKSRAVDMVNRECLGVFFGQPASDEFAIQQWRFLETAILPGICHFLFERCARW